MAVISPAFRKKFPLLVTGGLLAMQPVAAQYVVAAEQFDCQASASGGWACAPRQSNTSLPPRPQPQAAATSSAKPANSTTSADEAVGSRGNAAVAGIQARPLTLEGTDHSRLDWVPREQLSAAQLAEVAPYCAGTYVEPNRPGMDDDTPLNQAPLYLSADASRYEQQQQVATLAGDVVMRQGRLQVEADEANLRQLENKGELVGNVRMRDRGALVLGDRAELQLDNGEAQIDNAEYVIHQARVHGSARYAKREANAVIRLKDGTYTRCEPGENTWELRGNNVTLDPNTGFGSATNVTLRVKDFPVFYTPYLYFPIDDRRQSGFLMPTIGSDSDSGLSVTTPYYFNLAPNFDATLYPNYMSKRGLLMEGELRYLTRSSEGQIGGAYLKDSEGERKNQSEYEDQRWMYSWQHRTGLDSRLLAEVDYTDISDPYYFQDLNTNLGITTDDFVNQRGTLTWRGDSYTARLNAHAYERATVTDVTPYDRLPQVTLDGKLPFQPGGLQLSYQSELVRFERSLKNGDYINRDDVAEEWYDNRLKGLNRAEGTRLHLQPAVSLPLEWRSGFLKPTLKYAYTQYDLDLDSRGRDPLFEGVSDFEDSPDRSVPIYSLDSGLYFDRETSLFGTARQTLEPRAFYLYVPKEDQDDIPVFDTSERMFTYDSLWQDNRFSGSDRIGDANQLSLGVTSRWLDADGFERQTASIGQAYYFEDRKVQMPGIDYRERDDAQSSVSPIAMAYQFRFNRDWRLASTFNWDPDQHVTRSGSAMFHYQPEDEPRKIVNLGYRYRNDAVHFDRATGTWKTGSDYGSPSDDDYIQDYYKISQHDLSTIWPLGPQWSLIGRWQYDYNRNRTLEAFGGFEYDSCCWKLRVVNRYWIDYDERSLYPDRNDQPDRGIFLQIVLKGLGGVTGNNVESFLTQGIEGYSEREEKAF